MTVKSRFDCQWVIEGDSAQKMLLDQGYGRFRTMRKYGQIWVLMTKELKKGGNNGTC
jgi:hypothetical protein